MYKGGIEYVWFSRLWSRLSQRAKQSTETLLLLECQIHGSHYYACLALIESQSLHIGQRLQLVREKDNEYDDDAIEIYTTAGEKLGYVPKKDNHVIARLLDQQQKLTVHIESIHTTAWEPVTVRIELVK